MCNDVKEIEALLDNMMDTGSDYIQNLTLILQLEKPRPEWFRKFLAHTAKSKITLPTKGKRVLPRIFVIHFANGWIIQKIWAIRSKRWIQKPLSLDKRENSKKKRSWTFTHESGSTPSISAAEEIETLLTTKQDARKWKRKMKSVPALVFSKFTNQLIRGCKIEKQEWKIAKKRNLLKQLNALVPKYELCHELLSGFYSLNVGQVLCCGAENDQEQMKRFSINWKSPKGLVVQITYMLRRLKVVTMLVHNSRFTALIDFDVVKNCYQVLEWTWWSWVEVGATPRIITTVHGYVSSTLGIVKSLGLSLDGFNIALDFLRVWKCYHRAAVSEPSSVAWINELPWWKLNITKNSKACIPILGTSEIQNFDRNKTVKISLQMMTLKALCKYQTL